MAEPARLGRSAPGYAPILLSAPAAAHFLSVSETMLRNLNIPRKVLGGKRLYDQRDLIAYADGLEYEGGETRNTSALHPHHARLMLVWVTLDERKHRFPFSQKPGNSAQKSNYYMWLSTDSL